MSPLSAIMPTTQSREIAAASRLEHVRYAIRDLACVADEVIRQGHKIIPLNIGDPITFDFATPAHLIPSHRVRMRRFRGLPSPRKSSSSIADAYGC